MRHRRTQIIPSALAEVNL